jgi:hypothetical protein
VEELAKIYAPIRNLGNAAKVKLYSDILIETTYELVSISDITLPRPSATTYSAAHPAI